MEVFIGLGLCLTSDYFAMPSLKVKENNASHVFLFKMWAQIQDQKMGGGGGNRTVCLGLFPPDKHSFHGFRPRKERHLYMRQRSELPHQSSTSLSPWFLGWSLDHTPTFILPATIWHGLEDLPGIIPIPCCQLVHRCGPRLALSWLKSVFI